MMAELEAPKGVAVATPAMEAVEVKTTEAPTAADSVKAAAPGDGTAAETEPPRVKRYPRPEFSAVQAKMDELNERRSVARARLKEMRAGWDKAKETREGGLTRIHAERQALNESISAIKPKQEEKSAIIKQLSQLSGGGGGGAGAANGKRLEAPPRQLRGIKTTAEVDQRIKDLEYYHNTSTMSLKEEKNLMSEINFLRHDGKDYIQKAEAARAASTTRQEERKRERAGLEEKLRAVEAEIAVLQPEINTRRANHEALQKSLDGEVQSARSGTQDIEPEVERAAIREADEAITKLLKDFDADKRKWKENEDAHFARVRWESQQEKERRAQEREARKAAEEARSVQDASNKEKGMCATLLHVLEDMLPRSSRRQQPSAAGEESTGDMAPRQPKPASLGGERSTPPQRDVAKVDASRLIGKTADKKSNEDDRYAGFGRKARTKRNIREVRRTDTPDDKRVPPLALDVLAAFEQLSVAPPTVYGDVPGCIKEIRRKQDHFHNKALADGKEVVTTPFGPASKTSEADEPAAAKKERAAVSGRSSSVMEDPPLSASAGGPSDSGQWPKISPSQGTLGSRPSFSDIIRGKAASSAQASGEGDGGELDESEVQTMAPTGAAAPSQSEDIVDVPPDVTNETL